MSKMPAIEELAEEIIEVGERPVDEWAVAATLESMGFRDVDAVDDYGKQDIFDLAGDVYRACLSKMEHRSSGRETDKDIQLRSRIIRFFRFYSSGLMFAMPMAGQIAALFIMRYSLWSYVGFTEKEATMISWGTILGFMVTGGFVQAIARRGYFYRGGKLHILAKDVCFHLIKMGTIAIFAFAALVYLLNSVFFPLFTGEMIGISLVYYILTSHLWMAMALLYTLEKRAAVLLSTLSGIGIVYMALTATSWDIIIAQWCGLAITVVIMYAISYGFFHREARKTKGNLLLAKLPRDSILIYAVRHYFVYGVLYFTYLFLDRLIGWSSPTGEKVPYLFWFRTPYELGMDWALLAFILSVAPLEHSIREFSKLTIPVQKKFFGWDTAGHNRHFTQFYLGQFAIVIMACIGSIAVVYYGGIWARDSVPDVKLIHDFFANPLTYDIFWVGAIGYAFTTIGLFNSSFFFTLSRPDFALKAIVPAFAVNLTAGFILSRAASYEYSVCGLLMGSIVFAVISTIYCRRLMHSLDYYYYSAY